MLKGAIRRFMCSARILLKNPTAGSPKPIILNESDLDEQFIRGSGHGGQKINKNMSCVQLKHLPTGLMVQTQRFRELVNNRKEARKLLILKLDSLWNGKESKLAKREDKIKRSKSKQNRRAKEKYGKKSDESPTGIW